MDTVKVYSTTDEVLVFPVDDAGAGIGEEEYFSEELGRDRENFDVMLAELPLMIEPGSLKVEANRVLT